MFGALNRLISRLDGEPQEQATGTRGAFGFQVLKNNNTELALEPWFDFIIGINGRNLETGDPTLFGIEVRNCAGTSVSLGVWSAKGQRIREVYVQVPHDTASLGLSLQWMPLASTEDVWHILEVTPNSPADLAGLLPYGDYVIGSPEGLIRGESGLGELVEDHLERSLRLYVYNHEYNVTRPVDIVPSRQWGGPGALGCTLGFGALHRIPAPLEEPPHAPGETMFETLLDEKSPPISKSPAPVAPGTPASPHKFSGQSDFLIPAKMPLVSTGTPPGGMPMSTPTLKREKRGKGSHQYFSSPNADIDKYFQEGEQRSKEEDHAPPTKPQVLPPPPKSHGPPKSAASSKTDDAA